MPNVYEIISHPDGSFDISHNGEFRDKSIPDEWLEDHLERRVISSANWKGYTGIWEWLDRNTLHGSTAEIEGEKQP